MLRERDRRATRTSETSTHPPILCRNGACHARLVARARPHRQYLHRNDASERRWSFIDGPITANNPMGVHHAWGRVVQGRYQRFHTMLGEKQRYQNGFDCQGLWIEVEVEKEHGFSSKKDILEHGVDRFVQECKDRVAALRRQDHGAVHPPRLLDGLGQLVLHELRREQLHDLALPQALFRARLDLQGQRRHALVPALRHRALGARDRHRGLPGGHAHQRLREVPAARPPRRVAARSGRRRPGPCRATSPPPSTPTSPT